VGGHHLVYLSKYFAPDSELRTMDEEEVRRWFLDEFRRMFPDVQESENAGTLFSRARYVDPVRKVGGLAEIPSLTGHGVEGLVLANNSQIYPRLPSGEAVVQYAGEVFGQLGVAVKAGGD
jgi:protoporphyrinogen oxidase